MVYGNTIYVHSNGKLYKYEVIEEFTASSVDMTVLENLDDNMLTLITCAGYDSGTSLYANRIVVRARLVREVTD
jgi:sortase (surface protein transpeptidase)